MKRRILLVDDIALNREILGAALGRDYEILEAGNGLEALDILRSNHNTVSAVLLDLMMPVMDGYQLTSEMQKDPLLSVIPIIIETSVTDEASEMKALSLGAVDYVSKPYNPVLIRKRLDNIIKLREASAAAAAAERDDLTGLYSRKAFFNRVSVMISEHEPGYYIMACFDVEKFKVINDQYGTQMGDDVLKYIANIFSEGFEAHGGICCRMTGDDFAAFYPTSFQYSPELSEIRKKAGNVNGLVAPITFSIGRYIVDDLSLTPSAMYDRAILATESIKGRYDTKIALYDESMRDYIIHEQEIVTDMERALDERQFEAWLQPQYNHSTGALIGAEALVRWRHPKRGLISPGLFIPIFEQNGFVYPLDKYVWEESCRYLRKWIDEGRNPLPVSVNISRYDIFRPDIFEVITGLVEKYAVPIELLRLEITESAFSKNASQIIAVVKRLVEYGFMVEIDDFGSGYSSLNTLKDVPAQVLKLDMKFLESSENSQRGGNIVESIVRMAKWLDMSVIAEGVETIDQADFLRSIGCSYVQGFLYAKPMPVNEYEALCKTVVKEEKLLALETVENLDNNAFGDPSSLDTLIFNSYVGGACIYEYHNGNIELLRATEKYAQVIGSAGMTVEDALRLNWAEHLDEKHGKKVIDDLEESIRTKREVTGEYIFLDLPGCPHETYLRSSMRVIASAGKRYLVYCTNENITAQRQSEERERLAAKQLRAIMENISGGVTATVVEGDKLRKLFANETYYRQLGYTKEEYEAQSNGMPNSVLPEDREAVMENAREISASGKPGSIVFRIKRTDGEIRWLRSNISIMKYPGEPEPVQLSVSTDITELREAEQKAIRLSEQMKAIMDNVDLGIIAAVVKNGEARYIFANDHYYEMLGYTKAQFENKAPSPFETVAPSHRQMVIHETSKLNSTGKSVVLVYNALMRSGAERVFRAAISTGRFTGVNDLVHSPFYAI